MISKKALADYTTTIPGAIIIVGILAAVVVLVITGHLTVEQTVSFVVAYFGLRKGEQLIRKEPQKSHNGAR